jgi:hypothetical protein
MIRNESDPYSRASLCLLVIGLLCVLPGCGQSNLSKDTALKLLKQQSLSAEYIDPIADVVSVQPYIVGPAEEVEKNPELLFLKSLADEKLLELVKSDEIVNTTVIGTTKNRRYQFKAIPNGDIIRAGENIIQWRIHKNVPTEITGIRQEGIHALVNYRVQKMNTDTCNRISRAIAKNFSKAGVPPSMSNFRPTPSAPFNASGLFTKYQDGWRYSGNAGM